MTEPLNTEAGARALPEVRAIYDLAREARPGWRDEWDRQCRAMIEQACDGLPLGVYQRWVLTHLSDEPVMCAAIANAITIAREAGPATREDGGDDAR